MNAIGFKHTDNTGQVQLPAYAAATAFVGIARLPGPHPHRTIGLLSHYGRQGHVVEFEEAVFPGDEACCTSTV